METGTRFSRKIAILFFLIQSAFSQQVRLNSATEWAALRDLRSTLGIRSNDWPRKTDPCLGWVGVRCRNGRVTGLDISGLRRTHAGQFNRQFFVDSLGNLTQLISLNASGFSLPGRIPDWFGQKLVALQVLNLMSCSVNGPIPTSLGSLSMLKSLYLSGNRLAGIIPSALGQLSGLEVLDLSRNSLTGSVPSSFSMLSNLTRLDVSSNFLSGPIPSGLGSLLNLQYLNLSDNSLTASIPAQLSNLSGLVDLDLGKNSLSGSLPDGLFSSLGQLQVVVLSENKLDGALPGELWSIPKLLFLDVSGNNFTGALPSNISNGNATGGMFNLSNNMLYGTVATFPGNISFTDLSSNYFQGKAPNEFEINVTLNRNCLQAKVNQRSVEDCRLFYDGRGLIFDNFGVPQPAEAPLPEPDSKSNEGLIFILVGVIGGLVFIVLLVLVLVMLLRMCNRSTANQRSANVGPVVARDIPRLPKERINISSLRDSFTYEQMLHFTGNFSEANVIKHGHSGDLFQGFLESRIPVVIKKVDLCFVKRESYLMELELLSKVSHIRLVPLLGCCAEHEREKFFVYKYMRNGDLAKSLCRVSNLEDDNLHSLDWITRLKIAIGAAEGLTHLHHECSPPLVHRDVQASSILLDDRFEVRLGSLSDVCAQEGDSHQTALTRFLRKQQPTEQGTSGSLSRTCAYDVYCFGKVLLQLVTGKHGITKTDDALTREWLEHALPHISIYDKELVTKIVDPSLIVDEDLLEEVWAMAIVARSCLNPKPSTRPPMKYVLKALENPLKVVREESSGPSRLRTTSSTRSWSAAFFGSWQHSSSESASVPGHGNREGMGGFRQSGRVGSYSSGGNELSSSHKRLSNENFPEPVDMQDLDGQDEHS